MIAVYNGNVDLLDLLISKRCDVRAKDEVVVLSGKDLLGNEN